VVTAEEGRRERGRELAFIIFLHPFALSLFQRCHEKEAIGDARCGHRQQHESKQRLKEAKGAKEKGKTSISDKQIRKCDRRRVSKMTGSVKKQIETEAKEGRRIKARWRREKKKKLGTSLSLFKKKGGRRITWSMA